MRVTSDIVVAIFHYLGAGQRFAANIPKIHESFYKICQLNEFAGLCQEMVFDTSKVYPYSDTIRNALDRLQKAELLACRNPGLNQYEITEELGAIDSDIEEIFNEPERILLKKAAEIFKEQIHA